MTKKNEQMLSRNELNNVKGGMPYIIPQLLPFDDIEGNCTPGNRNRGGDCDGGRRNAPAASVSNPATIQSN